VPEVIVMLSVHLALY